MENLNGNGFSIGDYVCQGGKGSVIGKGSFADVYLGYHKTHNYKVAIKVVDVARLTKGSEKLKHHLTSEISIMKAIDHENIVKLFDVFTPSEDRIYMIMEYCAGGDLSKYIARKKSLSEERARVLMRHLANGLKFLHSRNIIHRDLKPQNLLLSSQDEATTTLKIADFGFARFITPQSLAETLCGSPLYMAPEILAQKQYSVKADLWSVGAILCEMLTGKPPFPVQTHIELLRAVDSGAKIQLPSTLKLSPECHNLLENLLQKDPLKRMSWEEFFMHPWLNLHTPMAVPTSHSPATSPLVSPLASPSQHQYQLPTESPRLSSSPYSVSTPITIGTPPQVRGSPQGHSHSYGASEPMDIRSLPNRQRGFTAPAQSPSVPIPHRVERVGSMHGTASPPSLPNYSRSLPNPTGMVTTSPPHLPTQLSRRNSLTAQDVQQSGVRMPKTNPFKDPSSSQPRSFQPSINSPPQNAFSPPPTSYHHPGSFTAPSPLSSTPTQHSFHPPPTTAATPSAGFFTGSYKNDAPIHALIGASPERDYALTASDTNPVSSLTRSVDESAVASDYETRLKRALAIASLGDMKFDNALLVDSFGLYIKTLTILQNLQHSIKRRLLYTPSLSENSSFVNVMARARERYSFYYHRVETIKQRLNPNDVVHSPEKFMYEFALHLGREGAVQELLHNYSKCAQFYDTGLALLETLLSEATHDADKHILLNFVKNFKRRLAQVKKSSGHSSK